MSDLEKSRLPDVADRGDKGVNTAGTATFFVGRLLDPLLQYAVLNNDWGRSLITRFGGSVLPQGPPLITRTPLDFLGLSPYRSIIWAMSFGGMLKQNYHVTAIAQEKYPVALGVQVGILELGMSLANSLLFVCAQTSASANGQYFPQTPLLVGSALYTSGIVLEWASEQQRHSWKKDPENKGKVYQGGFWSLSRHINYFGYTLWHAGNAVAAGGWLWGTAVGVFLSWNFLQFVIPAHQRYMEGKYGAQYEEYKKATPYRFIPWLL